MLDDKVQKVGSEMDAARADVTLSRMVEWPLKFDRIQGCSGTVGPAPQRRSCRLFVRCVLDVFEAHIHTVSFRA